MITTHVRHDGGRLIIESFSSLPLMDVLLTLFLDLEDARLLCRELWLLNRGSVRIR